MLNLMLNDEICKYFNKKMIQRINLLSIIFELWDRDSLIKDKLKQIMKSNSQLNTILNDEIIEKKSQLKKLS
jgi:hypothetical protein